MTLDLFLERLINKAQKQGLSSAEAYVAAGTSFECMATNQEIKSYSANETRGIGFRGMYKGKIGYAATEALDDEAIDSLILNVKESAELSEDDSGIDIFEGEKNYPTVEMFSETLEAVPVENILNTCLDIEKEAKQYDKRITQVPYCQVGTDTYNVRIVNSFGLDIDYKRNNYFAYVAPVATDGKNFSNIDAVTWGYDFSKLSAKTFAKEAVDKSLFALGGRPVKSGNYQVVIENRAMSNMLGTFSGIFSAENAQEGLSLLSGKEGSKVASEHFTLMDDPLLAFGPNSKPFDAEGCRGYTKAVIENGILRTLLHNRKTAKKQGIKSTANAGKAGYAGTMRVAPSNFYIVPGEKSLEQLHRDIDEGLVIIELGGLHSGANPISGDFSLIAKGYRIENGKKTTPVEQITIAGNFYELLKNVQTVGNDLVFPGSNIGSPSVYVGEIAVAGK